MKQAQCSAVRSYYRGLAPEHDEQGAARGVGRQGTVWSGVEPGTDDFRKGEAWGCSSKRIELAHASETRMPTGVPARRVVDAAAAIKSGACTHGHAQNMIAISKESESKTERKGKGQSMAGEQYIHHQGGAGSAKKRAGEEASKSIITVLCAHAWRQNEVSVGSREEETVLRH